MKSNAYREQATHLIEQSGQRATPVRVRVLAFLLSRQNAVTHHEIEYGLGSDTVDRVTLYRALDWLIDYEFAHRLTNEDRVWRFLANSKEHHAHQQHAHFRCTRCDMLICLENVPVQMDVPIPNGFRMHDAELTVKGVCAMCG